MAVFRVERNTGYTVMSNHHLRNKELSLKAKGLLSQMLSLPEDWDYTLAGLSYINRKKKFMYFFIVFALVYCNVFFLLMGYSWIFCAVTSVFLIIAGCYQRYSHKGVGIDCISEGNLLDISKALLRMNQLNLRWLYFGIPFALCWIVWFMFESYPKVGGEMICYGGSVGFVLGAAGGILHCIRVRHKAKEAIHDIEEYTKDN